MGVWGGDCADGRIVFFSILRAAKWLGIAWATRFVCTARFCFLYGHIVVFLLVLNQTDIFGIVVFETLRQAEKVSGP